MISVVGGVDLFWTALMHISHLVTNTSLRRILYFTNA